MNPVRERRFTNYDNFLRSTIPLRFIKDTETPRTFPTKIENKSKPKGQLGNNQNLTLNVLISGWRRCSIAAVSLRVFIASLPRNGHCFRIFFAETKCFVERLKAALLLGVNQPRCRKYRWVQTFYLFPP